MGRRVGLHRAGICLCLFVLTSAPVTAAEASQSIDAAYPDIQKLRAHSSPVVCILDSEHPEKVKEGSRHRRDIEKLKQRIELELAGVPCLVVHSIVRLQGR